MTDLRLQRPRQKDIFEANQKLYKLYKFIILSRLNIVCNCSKPILNARISMHISAKQSSVKKREKLGIPD